MEVRPPGGIALRTLVTSVLAGGVAGLATGGITTGALFVWGTMESGLSVTLESLPGVFAFAVLGLLVGLTLGAVVAIPVTLLLLPVARWSAATRPRARVAACLACLVSTAALEATFLALTRTGESSSWSNPLLLGPALIVAGIAGAWRGPDLVSRGS